MANPEQRKIIFYLGLTGAVASIVAISGFGADKISETKNEQSTSTSHPEREVAKNGRDCEVVDFYVDGQRRYVTVPTWDSERIQQEVNQGNFSSIEGLTQCGDTGVILTATETATFQAPNYEEPRISEVQAKIDLKQRNDVFEVTIKDGRRYKVKKMNQGRLQVLELLEGEENFATLKKFISPSDVIAIQ